MDRSTIWKYLTIGKKKEKLVNFLVASRGNHQTLKDFLSAIRKEKDAISWEEIRAIWILESLSAKDLRDVTLDVLNDHLLTNISDWEKIEADLFKRMYLNPPRIANEMLTPYKKELREAIEKTVYQSVPDSMKRDPKALIEWCRKEIKIDNELNSQQIPVSPMGVWKARVADEKSRDIFFVAAYRSMGWASAAWIDEVTGKVQILNEEFAKEDVNFDTAEAAQSRKECYKRLTRLSVLWKILNTILISLSPSLKTAHSSYLIMTKERRIWGMELPGVIC